MSPYREGAPPVVRECECSTGPLFDCEDDTGNNYPVCGPCIDRMAADGSGSAPSGRLRKAAQGVWDAATGTDDPGIYAVRANILRDLDWALRAEPFTRVETGEEDVNANAGKVVWLVVTKDGIWPDWFYTRKAALDFARSKRIGPNDGPVGTPRKYVAVPTKGHAK
jgi:hypothetical protein